MGEREDAGKIERKAVSLHIPVPGTGEQSFEIRTVIKDGEPWFVAMDICDALAIVNVGNAVNRLDSDEKSYIRRTDLGLNP